MRYISILLLSLIVLFAAQSIAIYTAGGSTIKSESNYFSSVARVQNGIRHHPEIMLLGSSRTGRLPDASSGFPGIANMGCDGGSAAITLRAIDDGIIPAARIIVIEGNTLLHDLEQRGQEISDALRSPWFRIGTRLPQLGAAARPAAFCYSKLLARKIGRSPGADDYLLPLSANPNVANSQDELPANAESLVLEMAAIFNRLHQRNIRLMLVILPPGAAGDSLNIQIPRKLSKLSGVPLLDLTDGLPAEAVRYTDGVHMDPASAAAALRTILDALKHDS